MTIALLCPTRGRLEQCKRMIESAQSTSTAKSYPNIYISKTQGDDIRLFHHIAPEGMPTAHRWNLLAEMAMQDKDNKLFMLAADDMIFGVAGWDKALLDHYNALENKIHIYALQDSRDENGTPHVIMTREYIEAMGYFVTPIFLHWFIDSWTVEIAKANNCFTHLKDYLLIHDKPSDKGQGDATHNGIRAMGWRERDQWVADKMKPWLEAEKRELGALIKAQKEGPKGKYV